MNGSKQHYLLLDGMRGVAALMVLGYHLFEAVAFAVDAPEQQMYHGFLAVDFFLVLSGFVMGYAYDDRWDKMSVGSFFKRRLIRLHPMVVMGAIIGVIVFIAQGCNTWAGFHMPWSRVLLSFVLALFLLPSPAVADVRDNTEIFPLNGPHWSLFFEYIGSILYALLLRRLSTRALSAWVVCVGCALTAYAAFGPDASIAYGWSSHPSSVAGGLLRMGFDYPLGLLVARFFYEKKPSSLSASVFWPCAAVLVLLLCVPSFSALACPAAMYLRVAFQVLCVAVAFPCIIWFCARGAFAVSGGKAEKSLKFLGDLSYPLYAVHYPFIYMYIGWIYSGSYPFVSFAWRIPVALAVAVISITVALLCMKFYDTPVRRWLSRL